MQANSGENIDQTIQRMRPAWRGRSGGHYPFFCPNCRAERRIRSHPSPSHAANYARIALLTGVFTVACWNWSGWRGLVAFVPFWVIFEFIYRSRVRIELVCPHCGFDPFLYLNDAKKARAGVEEHWRKVFREKGIPYPGEPVQAPPSVEVDEAAAGRGGEAV